MALSDAATIGIAIQRQGYDALIGKLYFEDITPLSFFFTPEPGERSLPTIWFGDELLDDGGGPAIAEYRYGRCPFVGK